jgi:peptidoglycan/LPS O-acetylase OafA/YrhL
LCGVLLAVTIAAVVLLYPGQLIHFGVMLAFASIGLSNLQLGATGNYFTASDNVLLHLWSLAVEAQFYILFPLFVVGLRRSRFRGAVGPAIAAVAVTSFALACIAVYTDTSIAFFSTPTRAWELLLGIAALRTPPAFLTRKVAANVITLAGIGAILASANWLMPWSYFPGFGALPACLGALAIILFADPRTTLVGNILAAPPTVFIGTISYSLYLVHLPLIGFASLFYGPAALTGYVPLFSLGGTSLLLAVLSWRLVEEPLRRVRWQARTVGRASAAAILLFAGIGGGIVLSRGLPERFPADASRLANYEDYNFDPVLRTGRCMLALDPNGRFDDALCATPDPHKKNWLLIGDSHAADIWSALQHTVPSVHVMQATAAACRMSLAPLRLMRPACNALMRHVFFDLIAGHKPDLVVLSARWHPNDIPLLADIFTYLHKMGIPVLVIGPNPEYTRDLPLLLADAVTHRDPGLVRRHSAPEISGIDAALAGFAASKGVAYVSLYKALCSGQDCLAVVKGAPVLFDSHHFTYEGAVAALERLRDAGTIPPG